MEKTIILNNLQRKQIVVFNRPLQQVYLESFHFNETNQDDRPSFAVIWSLKESGKNYWQYYNLSLSQKVKAPPHLKQHDLLRRLRSCYPIQESFYSFTLQLGKPFRSDENALYIHLDIPD